MPDPTTTLLVIGASLEDARAFVGMPPAGSQEPIKEDRPSKQVPNSIWPDDLTVIGRFWGMDAGAWPMLDDKGPYDIVILTANAYLWCLRAEQVLCADPELEGVVTFSRLATELKILDHLRQLMKNPGGQFWCQPPKREPRPEVPDHERCHFCQRNRTTCGHFVGAGAL